MGSCLESKTVTDRNRGGVWETQKASRKEGQESCTNNESRKVSEADFTGKTSLQTGGKTASQTYRLKKGS